MIMELKRYQNIMRVFSSLILVLTFQFSHACVEGPNASEHTRIAIFEAQRKGFSDLTPFHYSANRFYLCSDEDYLNNYAYDADKKLNCAEWQKKLGRQIRLDDVFLILYKTKSQDFINAYEKKALQKVFKTNTFVKVLSLKKNKAFLDYIVLAKKIEYNSNSWSLGSKYSLEIDNIKHKLPSIKDQFLKQRFAFLILRNSFYHQNSQEVKDLYKTYFENKTNSILGLWAFNYRASYFENAAYANYLVSKILTTSKYKPYIILQNYKWNLTEETLALTKNNDERSVILSIENFRNAGPCLNEIKKIARLSPNNLFLSFLIGREINKLEDWIYTPQYTSYEPSIEFPRESEFENYEQSKKENHEKDILYLRDFRKFLIHIYRKTSGEQKDYVAAAIAHLFFMDDEIDLGRKYTQMISNEANSSIQMQKNIQLSLLSLRQDDLKNKIVQDQLALYFNSVESLAKKDSSLRKCLYSLYLIAAEEFRKRGDAAYGGLFYLKSYSKNEEIFPEDFFSIDYFNQNATMEDMDHLISLKRNKNKTSFEKFICDNLLHLDLNLLKDLKGTIAFRNDDLELACKTFERIPKDFWMKKYAFKKYLNEDPFVPKVLQRIQDRKYDYHFNKAEFVAKLINLKKQNTATSNLELAHAYFNVSLFGNSWMMVDYSWSEYNELDTDEIVKGNQNGNYFNLKTAKQYYIKALRMSKNKDEKALASLMIFKCNYLNYKHSGFNSYDINYFPIRNKTKERYPLFYETFYAYSNDDAEFKGLQELINFYSIYKITNTFKKYNCSLLEEFIN